MLLWHRENLCAIKVQICRAFLTHLNKVRLKFFYINNQLTQQVNLSLYYCSAIRIPLLSEFKFAKHFKESTKTSLFSIAKYVLTGAGFWLVEAEFICLNQLYYILHSFLKKYCLIWFSRTAEIWIRRQKNTIRSTCF